MPEHVLYLQPAHRLSDAPPDASAPPSTFTFDPADPTPTIGGRLLSPEGGYRDDTRLAAAPDVRTSPVTRSPTTSTSSARRSSN